MNHAYEGRLVAKEIKIDKRFGVFAASLLEAKEAPFSSAVAGRTSRSLTISYGIRDPV